MLTNHTLDKQHSLRLMGIARCSSSSVNNEIERLACVDERLGLLVDHEILYRENRRRPRLLRDAKLRVNACVEDIDYRHPRGLKRAENCGPYHLRLDQAPAHAARQSG